MASLGSKATYLSLITLVVVFIAGTYYWSAKEPTTTGDATHSPVEDRDAQDPSNPVVFKRKLPQPVSADVPLWRAIDESSVRKLPFYATEWSTDGRALVRVAGAATAAQSWRVGDRLTISLPQLGETYNPTIDEIDDGPGYSRAALGKVVGADGRSRRIVVTVGPTSTFAYIDTPDGSYELVANDELGWLLPTASMMAGVDFSEPDYILPEDRQMERVLAGADGDDSGRRRETGE